MNSYTCPYCGADDSTRCDMLPEDDPRKKEPYTEKQMARARGVGCRVIHYIDEKNATGN